MVTFLTMWVTSRGVIVALMPLMVFGMDVLSGNQLGLAKVLP